jgi:CheY-like chemotaxis protein
MKELIRVLIADDIESERELVQLALRRLGGFEIVGLVENGNEVLEYLRGHGKFADREQYPMPDVLFLDLKMPMADGFDVLRTVRGELAGEHPLMLVFTASDDAGDREVALELGADDFYTKPTGMEDTIQLLRTFRDGFWRRHDGDVKTDA